MHQASPAFEQPPVAKAFCGLVDPGLLALFDGQRPAKGLCVTLWSASHPGPRPFALPVTPTALLERGGEVQRAELSKAGPGPAYSLRVALSPSLREFLGFFVFLICGAVVA